MIDHTIDERLEALGRQAFGRENWREGTKLLVERHGTSTGEQRLAVFKTARDSMDLPSEVGFFLVAWAILAIFDDRDSSGFYDSHFQALYERARAIERRFGLRDGEHWRRGGGPAEWETTNDELDELDRRLCAAVFVEYDETGLAALFDSNPTEFNRRYEQGWRMLLGSTGTRPERGDESL